MMEIYVVLLAGASALLSLICLVVLLSKKGASVGLDERDLREIKSSFSDNVNVIAKTLADSQLKTAQTLEVRLSALERRTEEQLAQIRMTVDEKLSKTINDRFNQTFRMLSDELEKVTKSLGEMQKVSADVNSLTRVLSNVKTTGIFGEVQLGAILEQVLSPQQYVKNVVTNKAGRDPVEFAVRLPGADGEVLLPIDSKFPYTVYNEMQTAYRNGNFPLVEEKRKQLIATVRSMARDVKEKYVAPPATTNFAILFLPIEGLYAEVVKLGMVEELQTKYSITVAGPTTMAALLNSLQMGFQTLAIQKKSAQVWQLLSAVKTEFAKFGDILEKVQKKLTETNNEIDTLVGVRTRVINSKLKSVASAPESAAQALLSDTDWDGE